jgi:hypothetical protein
MKRIIILLTAMCGFLPFFGFGGMSSSDLQKKAEFLGFGGETMYTGENDALLSFDGNGDWFGGQIKSYTLTITNGTDADTVVNLFRGYKSNETKIIVDKDKQIPAAGITLDATIGETSLTFTKAQYISLIESILSYTGYVFDAPSQVNISDGIIFTATNGKTISCAGSPSEINDLMTYLTLHPTWLTSMKMRTTNAAQFQQSISLTEINPYSTKESRNIPLTLFTTNKDQVTTLIDVPVGMTVGDTTNMSIKVTANSVLNITFFFGASLDTSKYVDVAALKAKETVILSGGTVPQSIMMKQAPVKQLL